MIRATIAQFYDLLDIIPPSKPILLIGDTGIGKTTIVRKYAERINQYFAYVACMSTYETVNLTGIPDVSGTHTVYKPMEWFKPGVVTTVLLDEINRSEYIINALMEIAVDQHIGSAQLAPGSRVIAAMNPSYGNKYMVKQLELSHMTRFCVIELNPTPEEWLAIAKEEGIHPAIISFINKYKTALDPEPDGAARASRQFYTNLEATRRGWYTLSEALYEGEKKEKFNPFKKKDGKEILELAVTGYVGPVNASKFCSFYYSMTFGNANVTADNDLTASILMEGDETRWKKEFPDKINRLCMENSIEAAELVTSVARYLESKSSVLYNDTTGTIMPKGYKYAMNFYKFLKSCTPEFVSQMYFTQIKPTKQKAGDDVTWCDILCGGCSAIVDLLDSVRTK